jgi:hypothetical protein
MELSNTNQVITPDIWGPVIWEFLHQVTLGYPINPSYEQKTKYKAFFLSLKDTLPCSICAEHYKQNLGTMPLDNQVLESKSYLVKWLIDFHNIVNEMKEKPKITFLEAKKIMDDKMDKHTYWHSKSHGINKKESNTLLAIKYFALGYSDYPTLEQKEKYRIFFGLIKDILPCDICKEIYNGKINKNPLDDKVLKNRETLNIWLNNLEDKKIKPNEENNKKVIEKFKPIEKELFTDIPIIEKSYPNTIFYLIGILVALIIIALIYRKN